MIANYFRKRGATDLPIPRLSIFLLFALCCTPLEAKKDKSADPPEVALGERLFLETRFAQAFRAFLATGHGVNDALNPGDPVMDTTVKATNSPLPGPFAGTSMNCRQCHLVDEQLSISGGGMRTYSDFARRSPIPRRVEDEKTITPRNSPPLVNASLSRDLGPQFHFDAEFPSLEALVAGTLTGRNYGWRPGEHSQAVQHVARVIREDNGQGSLAGDFGGLSYATVLAGTGPLPQEFRLKEKFRLSVAKASDDEIFAAVNRLIAAYTEQLEFSRGKDGNFNLTPFDVFLDENKLPKSPSKNESTLAYSRRLLAQIDQLASRGALQYVSSNPNTPSGQFDFHTQPFQFGPQELQGLRIFMREPHALPASSTELAPGGVGSCVTCHAAPIFTDIRFRNTGTAQIEYDGIHGTGAFAALNIPGLATRSANPNAYLPATALHPLALEPFRAVPSVSTPGFTDLGVWNIFANPDFPGSQALLNAILCQDFAATPADCTQALLLPKTIAVFKTPGLRDLSHSAPYMHTGQFDTLEDIITFYRTTSDMMRAGTLRNGARELSGIALLPADTASLVAFLKSLNEDYQ